LQGICREVPAGGGATGGARRIRDGDNNLVNMGLYVGRRPDKSPKDNKTTVIIVVVVVVVVVVIGVVIGIVIFLKKKGGGASSSSSQDSISA
jgi:heme/copper-type cytochrome/quinol oxidase subunit 2